MEAGLHESRRYRGYYAFRKFMDDSEGKVKEMVFLDH